MVVGDEVDAKLFFKETQFTHVAGRWRYYSYTCIYSEFVERNKVNKEDNIKEKNRKENEKESKMKEKNNDRKNKISFLF